MQLSEATFSRTPIILVLLFNPTDYFGRLKRTENKLICEEKGCHHRKTW